jgi:hypothetical protein
MTEGPESVGIILVHGIGEQRRFEHLDGQTRLLLDALRIHPGVEEVSVDIGNPSASTFLAEQDSWNPGPEPAVNILVRWRPDTGAIRETRFAVHEVWWADVNESYSIAKQVRFWLWGLAIWAHPGKPGSSRPIARRHWLPAARRGSALYDRIRLFLSSAFFALLGLSLGPIGFVVKRLFHMKTPDVLRVVTNYLSAVKLYVQRRRFGPGLWWAREEFLDSMGEPPRVSIRRRMVRALADVACARYERWYVLAHSQGTVVAFNGLMADSYEWPGYLDEPRWKALVAAGLAGPAARAAIPPAPPLQPPPPGWARGGIVYRRRVFQRFRGFLSYGSPLEKFAAIWTDLVRISREAVFCGAPAWINLYDPIDPVSGRLEAYAGHPPECCPPPRNLGYCASWWLLLAHLKYLTGRRGKPDAASATVRWLLTDSTDGFPGATGWSSGDWFSDGSVQFWVRSIAAWAMWLIAAAGLALIGAIVLPLVIHALQATYTVLHDQLAQLTAKGH